MPQVLANDPPLTVITGHPSAKICKPSSHKGRYNFVTCRNVTSGFEMWRHLTCLQSIVVDNAYQRNCDYLKTTRDVPRTPWKRQRTEGCDLQRNLNVIKTNFWRRQIFNMLKIYRRTRLIISAVCVRQRIRQRQVTTRDDWNSKLNVACRTPLFVTVWEGLKIALI